MEKSVLVGVVTVVVGVTVTAAEVEGSFRFFFLKVLFKVVSFPDRVVWRGFFAALPEEELRTKSLLKIGSTADGRESSISPKKKESF